MLWIGVYDSVLHFLPTSGNFSQPLKRSEPTFHNQQPDQLCEGDVLHCVRKMVVTLNTDWPPDPQYSKTTHFIVASLRHTCCLISVLICHSCEVDGLSQQRRSVHQHRFRQICEQYWRETELLCTKKKS